MNHRTTLTVVLAALLAIGLFVPAAAATPPNETVDECKNAENGHGADGGPPVFVADLVPEFLSDLLGSLPVPNFVKSAVGASTC
ncbi:hypothetical protein [Halolamina sp.]|jgi:hypothetical protein|uniref:hypothetical protein n=1 Tax=Halolamina sp. TaxID=1940283 RepID=UPI000223B898|nr:hypothetical protein Halar_0825 [halophilic archaeon DL31]